MQTINLSDSAYALRLNFKGSNTMVFAFGEDVNPTETSEEIAAIFAQKMEFLDMKVNGKSPFVRKGDILPKRKVTIDVFCRGTKVNSALLNVEIKPSALNGEFLKKVAFTLLTSAVKIGAKLAAKVEETEQA